MSAEQLGEFIDKRYLGIGLEHIDDKCQAMKAAVIKEYRPFLEGRNITIRTFLFLYPEIVEKCNNPHAKEIIRLTESDKTFCELFIKGLTVQDILDLVERLCADSSASNSNCMEVMQQMTFLMHQSGYIRKNILDEYLKSKASSRSEASRLRSAISRKSFTTEEIQRIYGKIKRLIVSTPEKQAMYCGVLLRLLTGLESNIICSLHWADFKFIERFGFYVLEISRQLTNNGKEKAFTNKYDYRRIPCSPIIQGALQKLMTYVKESCRKDDISEMYIVVSDISDIDRPSEPVKPPVLSALCKDLLREVRIKDVFISVPDEDSGTKEFNVAKYGGDMFRENFKYWCFTKIGMTEDEVAFLLGNQPATTFGLFYCDYMNASSQFVLYTKLRRMDAFLERSPEFIEEKTEGVTEMEIQFKSDMPVQIDLNVLPDSEKKVELAIDYDFGHSVITDARQED